MKAKKIPIEKLRKMSAKQIGKHIEDITQTPVCKDKTYCSNLLKLYTQKNAE